MALIEVYADIWCPFAHVGLRSVIRRRNQLGRDDVVRVRAWPLELVDGAPLDRASTAEHVEALRTGGVGLSVTSTPTSFPHTTLPALAVVAAAYRRDDRTGEAVSLALRNALFEEGRDISRPDVLASVASAHGVGRPDARDDKTVHAEWHEGERVASKDRRTSSAGTLKPSAHRSTSPRMRRVSFASGATRRRSMRSSRTDCRADPASVP